MSGGRRQTNSCECCRRYQQEINELQARIFALESEKGLHDTIPVSPSGKKSIFSRKPATFNLNLNDSVSFPKLCKNQPAATSNKVRAKPKRYEHVKSPKIQLTNRFLPLSDNEVNEQRDNGSHDVDKRQQTVRESVPNVKVIDTLLIGDGAISGVKHGRMQTCCFPSATVSEMTSLLPNVLSKHGGVKQLIVHVGAVDIRKEQSEVLKRDFMNLFEELDKVDIKAFISGPLPNIDRKINKFSRLLQLNTWLSKECAYRQLHYIENFYLFWRREDLFKRNGPHVCLGGVRALTENLLHALRHQNGPGPGPEQRVTKERDERRNPVPSINDHANVSTSAAEQQPPPQKDSSSVPTPSKLPPPSPEKKSAAAQTSPPPPEKNSATAAASPQKSSPCSVKYSGPSSEPLPQGSSSPPRSDQLWVPPATSTPTSTATADSFSSPPSPRALPNHLESLIKEGIKMVPLTPDITRSRVLLSTYYTPTKVPPPLPPRSKPSPPSRPPPPASRAAISHS